MAIKTYTEHPAGNGKALTTGFINIALNAGAHFSEYRNLRIPLMLLPTIFNRVCTSSEGRTKLSNSALQKSEDSWYDIVRRSDGCVVFSFPSSGRHLIYRVNGMVSMRPLLDDEEVLLPTVLCILFAVSATG